MGGTIEHGGAGLREQHGHTLTHQGALGAGAHDRRGAWPKRIEEGIVGRVEDAFFVLRAPKSH